MQKIFINGTHQLEMTPAQSLEIIESRQPGSIHSISIYFKQLGARNEMLFAAPRNLKLTAGFCSEMDGQLPYLQIRISPINKATGAFNEKGEARITRFAQMIRERLNL